MIFLLAFLVQVLKGFVSNLRTCNVITALRLLGDLRQWHFLDVLGYRQPTLSPRKRIPTSKTIPPMAGKHRYFLRLSKVHIKLNNANTLRNSSQLVCWIQLYWIFPNYSEGFSWIVKGSEVRSKTSQEIGDASGASSHWLCWGKQSGAICLEFAWDEEGEKRRETGHHTLSDSEGSHHCGCTWHSVKAWPISKESTFASVQPKPSNWTFINKWPSSSRKMKQGKTL